jgi:hypothetical protein
MRSGLALTALLLAVGVAAACGEEEITRAFGRNLDIAVSDPVLVDRFAFTDTDGNHRLLFPTASNRRLALVEITVSNRTATIVKMLIDPSAAQLGYRRGDRFDAVDLFQAAQIVDVADPEEDKYMPLLWGEVDLARYFQAGGWMVFDIPKGMTLGSLWWSEADDMIADYVSRFHGQDR